MILHTGHALGTPDDPSSPRRPPQQGAIGPSTAWRIVSDELQWLLQHREGNRWNNRSYCCTRAGLLRCVGEYCGEVDAEALAQVRALPDWHPDRASTFVEPDHKEPAESKAVEISTSTFVEPLLPEGSYKVDYPLTYDAVGNVELPECLDRRKAKYSPANNLSDAA
jgi:hypothetical protein